jgi:4-hydroxy-tetrahydrodipicolinate reductase
MNIIVVGPGGKMGSIITKTVVQRNDMKVIAGLAPMGRDYLGKDIGIIAGLGKEIGAPVVGSLEDVIDRCDIIIDYTVPEASMEVMETALKHGKAVVCGTTGFTDEEKKRIFEISKGIPLLFAANSSRIVNLMYELLETVVKRVGIDSDIEIIEMHDRNKKDAPSGTSREMGEIMAKAMDKELNDLAVYGREGKGKRKQGTIGYHSLRAGDISSSHTVIFGFQGERLEITHHTHNWQCFATGACEGAAFLYGKEPGLYSVKDVIK